MLAFPLGQGACRGKVGKIAAKGQEARYNDYLARKLQRELNSTHIDAEGMLQAMSGMEGMPRRTQRSPLSGRERR